MLATTIQHSNTTPHHQSEATTHHACAVSKPNSVSNDLWPTRFPAGRHVCCCTRRRSTTDRHPARLTIPQRDRLIVVLLRKEVIQPHLPVRLPCYDFVPIVVPTFDHSLPDGLGHGLRVLPTFMT